MRSIRTASTPCVINSRPSFGAPYLFHAIAAHSENVLWIELSEGDDSVRIGNRLSNALLRATGATLFGMGMPYQYGLSYLTHLTEELGPITLLVGNAQADTRFTSAALHSSSRSDGALRVIAAGSDDSPNWRSILSQVEPSIISESDLKVTRGEALAMFREVASFEAPLVTSALALSGGAYEGLLAGVNGATGGRPPARPSPDGTELAPAAHHLDVGHLERLMAEERWQEAFEYSIELGSDLAIDLIADAADIYFSNGEVFRFLQFAQRLYRAEPHHPIVMYWLFQAHVSVGRLSAIEDRAARFISRFEAPELQAAFASAARPPNALELAETAVAMKRSPETLASLGFLRVMRGDAPAGVQFLKEAFEGFKAARRYHKAIQLSNSIGSAHVQIGDYRRAMYWAQWSLDELRRRGIREELLRLSSINLLAFTQLLIGEVEAGEEHLRRIDLDVQGPLPATLEGLISTFGDYAIVSGNANEGIKHYERLVKQLGSQLPGFSAHNLARGLVHAGRVDDAAAALDVAADVGGASDEIERVNIDIGRVLVNIAKGTYTPKSFDRLMGTTVVQSDAVKRAELTICHASFLISTGARSLAQKVLRDHRDVLENLGRAGWSLLAPPGTDVDDIRSLLGGTHSRSARLCMLGMQSVRRDGEEEAVSLRTAELLVILASHPDGLSGEALLYEMYGDAGVLGTLKATVSRSRRVLEIESVPYRLHGETSCDFLEVEQSLQQGRLREALELYKGPLLPQSEAPGVRRVRERVDEAVRQAILHAGEWDLALRLARKFPDDLELWEEAERLAPKNDPAYPLIRARIRRIRGEWGL